MHFTSIRNNEQHVDKKKVNTESQDFTSHSFTLETYTAPLQDTEARDEDDDTTNFPV